MGRFLTGSVPAEKFLDELIVLPTRFEHFAGELRLCFSSTGLRDTLVSRKSLCPSACRSPGTPDKAP